MTRETGTPHDQWLADYQDQLNEALDSLANQQQDFSPLISDAVIRGRKIRSVLALQYAKWQGWKVSANNRDFMMMDLARVELIHSGSCIIDDLIDGDNQRRGLPAFHVRHGLPQAHLTAPKTPHWLSAGAGTFFAHLTFLFYPVSVNQQPDSMGS